MKKLLAILLIASLIPSGTAQAAPNNFIEVHPEGGDYPAYWGSTFVNIPGGLTLSFTNKYIVVNAMTTGSIWMTKSYDGGLTWVEDTQLTSRVGNLMPNPVYDFQSRRVILLYSRYTAPPHIEKIISNEITDIHAPITWSAPKTLNIDRQYPLLSSAAGIATSRGTIVFPFAYYKSLDYYVSSVLISYDGGDSFQIGGVIDYAIPTGNGVDEPAIVELSNGDLLAYVRTNQYFMGESRSTDGGLSWSPVTLTGFKSIGGGFRGEQVELRRVGNDILLAYAGDTEETVKTGKIYLSTDDCQTWSEAVEMPTSSTGAKSFFHICQVGTKQAVVSWWVNENNLSWFGESYRFSLDLYYLYIPPFEKKEDGRIHRPQPVIDDPIVIQPQAGLWR